MVMRATFYKVTSILRTLNATKYRIMIKLMFCILVGYILLKPVFTSYVLPRGIQDDPAPWKSKFENKMVQSSEPLELLIKNHTLHHHSGKIFKHTYSNGDEDFSWLKGKEDAYIYTSDSLPKMDFRPSVANGHVGVVVHRDMMHMNGLYNGYGTSSHRAHIPYPHCVNVTATEPQGMQERVYKLDVSRGVYEENLINPSWTVTTRVYAHQTLLPVLVTEIEVNFVMTSNSTVHILLNVTEMTRSPDLKFSHVGQSAYNVSHYMGHILIPETNTSSATPVHMFCDDIPNLLTVPMKTSSAKWIFIVSVHAYEEQAWDAYKQASKLAESGSLLQTHTSSWSAVWQRGRVDVTGNLPLARIATASYYNILSSIPQRPDPTWPYTGLSPSGLPWGFSEYHGHSFWDQETWMYPSILWLHQDVGYTLISTRKRTIAAAASNAGRHGHQGLQYPWESAYTGEETSPSYDTAMYEIHVNGDISFAHMQYYWASGNTSMFTHDVFSDIITGIADFFIGEMVLNPQNQMFEIYDVMGPDEFHVHVNNSVYTNTVAKISLQNAAVVANITGHKPKVDYAGIAEKIYIPFDEDLRYHPEYDGYDPGITIKQADVILLGFPLMVNLSRVVRRNDLLLYQGFTSPAGPAMTWSMHTVGWLELGQPERAQQNLEKTFLNVASPFQVWTENINRGGVPNFITGMGGFLQSLIAGYGGLRLTDACLQLNPSVPPNATTLSIVGIDYHGNSLDMNSDSHVMNITLTTTLPKAPSLVLREKGSPTTHLLQPGKTLHLIPGIVTIMKA